ncbi:MAG: NADH-quinone oxidoreductase subunit L [SAR324 cluster bacterium]|uniref:NADH-quinone oxidoreductase subunit L n=1 Tax=SAR324 cluster bacterium TaxID=2024889 RepID=A0A7X9FTT3_9DELT|nr:NADH-quinone oxidoreductase subunit L [SAR324 cluster bacterium]
MLTSLILIPLLLVMLINLPLRKALMNFLGFWLAFMCALTQVAFALCADPSAWITQLPELTEWLHFQATIDTLSRVMILAIGLVSSTGLMLCRYWTQDGDRRFLYSNLFLLSLAGMNGIVLASDFITLYVFLEITAVSSFILIAFDLEKAGFEGAFKYFLLSAIATALLLIGIGIFFTVAGSTSFLVVAIALKGNMNNWLVLLACAAFISGLLIKAGVMPFHGWLPDAYSSAPAPASVLLAGIVTKTTGVYTIMRITQSVFGFSPHLQLILLCVGCLSMLAGALLALHQVDFKRMLAYSSISQVGYIILGLGAASPLGIVGAVFHLFNHAVFKTLLFINASAVEKETGTRNMEEMGGLSNRMPLTGASSVVGFLSTAGIPPLSGFWSKLMIIVALWQAGYPYLAVTAVIASLITLAYFLSMQRRVFFGKTSPEYADLFEANPWATTPAIVLAIITISLGLCVPWLFETFIIPIRSFL